MAVRIARSDLSEEQVEFIRKNLSITPKGAPGFLPFAMYSPEKEPVVFYTTERNSQGQLEVLLPYTFASALTQKVANGERTYPQVRYSFKGQLREYQQPVAAEALEQLRTRGTTLLGLYPGFGKTVVASYLASQLEVLTVVIYHRTILGDQWKSTFENCTNAKVWLVGSKIVGPSIDYEGIKIPTEFSVMLCMDTQLAKLPRSLRDMIGCLVVDEAHAFCTPSHVGCWLATTPKYVITATATPDRDDGLDIMRDMVCGKHGVFKASTKPFTLVRFLTGIRPSVKKNAQGTNDWGHTVKELCEHETRNAYILELVKSHLHLKIMILTWSRPHALKLQKWLTALGITAAVMAGTTKTYSDSQVLVGTVSKIGTGFDEQAACANYNGIRISMLIFVGSTKSPKVIEQTLGRVFRSDDPYVIAFIDESASIKRHWGIMKKWALSRNAQISDYSPTKDLNALDETASTSTSTSTTASTSTTPQRTAAEMAARERLRHYLQTGSYPDAACGSSVSSSTTSSTSQDEEDDDVDDDDYDDE